MKNLLMFRHAQTEIMAKSDMARQLTEKGTADAAAIGNMLHRIGVTADIIVSSPAARAKETARLIAHGIRYNENALVTEKLIYNAHAEDLVSFIRNFDDTVQSLIIVGHNPTMMQAINILGSKRIAHLYAGHGVKFQFNTASWENIGIDTCSYQSRLA